MSRLQAGALGASPAAGRALEDGRRRRSTARAGAGRGGVDGWIPDDLPEVMADPGLLERDPGQPAGQRGALQPAAGPAAEVTVSEHGDRVEIRVVDHGPGVAEADRERIFLPFQRLGDRDNATGVGLGLALSRGLAEAMGGTPRPRDTPRAAG